MIVGTMLKTKGNDVFEIAPDDSLTECISLLNQQKIGALLVVDRKGKVSGIISERDILQAADTKLFKPSHTLVKDVMTPVSHLITATPQETLEDIMQRMTVHRVRHLPVMDGDRIAGMISIGDVVKTLLEESRRDNEHMKNYISGRHSANY